MQCWSFRRNIRSFQGAVGKWCRRSWCQCVLALRRICRGVFDKFCCIFTMSVCVRYRDSWTCRVVTFVNNSSRLWRDNRIRSRCLYRISIKSMIGWALKMNTKRKKKKKWIENVNKLKDSDVQETQVIASVVAVAFRINDIQAENKTWISILTNSMGTSDGGSEGRSLLRWSDDLAAFTRYRLFFLSRARWIKILSIFGGSECWVESIESVVAIDDALDRNEVEEFLAI